MTILNEQRLHSNFFRAVLSEVDPAEKPERRFEQAAKDVLGAAHKLSGIGWT
jgi:hypothetical protein